LLPRSLLARTFLAIAVVLIVAMGAWFAIIRAYEFEPRAQQAARMVVSVVNLTRSALLTASPDLRRELLYELAERERIQIYPADEDDKLDSVADTAFMRRVSEIVRESLGPKTRFALARNGLEGFWVTFPIEEDEYWVAMETDRLSPPLQRQLIGWGLLALTLALVGAYFIVFRIKRPIGALAGAARAVGKGEHPPPLEEDGPDELRTMATAFNQMTRDLARLDSDRALILAGVSHDLRTPLARLRLGIEMSGADAQTRSDMAMDIEEMDRIIGQFLDFARAESGEPAEPVDLAALGREVVAQYAERQRAIKAEITATGVINLRPKAIRRLIVNLIDNAHRYAGDDVTLAIHLTASRGATIEVLDRGPGIAVDQVERLKRPFQRMEMARSNVSGSGLGLAIVERIARQHGAALELLTREGGGLVARTTIRAS
jgi:two-component system, OmpR family, osmolarity sensor histidine kinase EnvZ